MRWVLRWCKHGQHSCPDYSNVCSIIPTLLLSVNSSNWLCFACEHVLHRYGYAAVVELLLRRGADANFKDSDGKTPLDVIGTDLEEDAREIVRTLLLEHAEKMRSTKQRRGSCPAIPRTALITAIDASGLKATATATPPAKVPADENHAFLPLPAVTIVRSAVDPAEPSGAGGVDNTGNHHQSVPVAAAAGVVRKGNRRGSFSSAAHIRVRANRAVTARRSVSRTYLAVWDGNAVWGALRWTSVSTTTSWYCSTALSAVPSSLQVMHPLWPRAQRNSLRTEPKLAVETNRTL